MPLDPLRVLSWRFAEISPFLDPRLTAAERRQLMESAAPVPVKWPSGREAPVPLSTLYRWLQRYRQGGPEALKPKERPPVAGKKSLPREWIDHALALLEEEPARSLFVLGRRLQDRYSLPRAPSRSSLHRALQREPRYQALRNRGRGERRVRLRFQASLPHEIWHADAKAPCWVTFADGSRHRVRVLSLLDDATRYVLAAQIVLSESLRAVVMTFRQAAARWGLPSKFYADRGSPYDADAFRQGLALLGVQRINTRARNPSAHGKIEAYHRPLERWFLRELAHQAVLDARHLQALLDAVIDQLYHEHVHRELGKTPRQALAETLSERRVSLERLREAFLLRQTLLYHPKDRTVRVDKVLFRVPTDFHAPGRQTPLAIDPAEPGQPLLVRGPGRYEPLLPAVRPAGGQRPPEPQPPRVEPDGALTPLLERYRGRILPVARAGFGLPEVYHALAQAVGRAVPATEAEAGAIALWLSTHGPLAPRDFAQALQLALARLGPGRPLLSLLAALEPRQASERKDSP